MDAIQKCGEVQLVFSREVFLENTHTIFFILMEVCYVKKSLSRGMVKFNVYRTFKGN